MKHRQPIPRTDKLKTVPAEVLSLALKQTAEAMDWAALPLCSTGCLHVSGSESKLPSLPLKRGLCSGYGPASLCSLSACLFCLFTHAPPGYNSSFLCSSSPVI